MERIFKTIFAGWKIKRRDKIQIRVFGKSEFAQSEAINNAMVKRARKAVKRFDDFTSRDQTA